MSLWAIDSEPLELRPNFTEDDLQVVIRAVYRQVLGNQHILEGDSLDSAESMLRNGDINVRGFVRAVAQSELYQSLFFSSSSPYRFIEMNCKHLLGRAPQDQAEISEHVQRYNAEGYEVEINSYIDSEEYLINFGDNVVPYARSTSTEAGVKNDGFNRMFVLMRGYANNDSGKSAQLINSLAANLPTAIKTPATGNGATSSTSKRYRIKVSTSTAAARLNKYSAKECMVDYSQMSQFIQSVHKSGGKIVSIAEVA
jgi:phycoerythrin-associated linker protein